MTNIVKTRLPADMLQFVQAKENQSKYIRDLIRADMTNEVVPPHNERVAHLLKSMYAFFELQEVARLKILRQDITMFEEIEKYVQ